MGYKTKFTTIWANFDPNRHMRHTAYNDYAAESRVRFFNDNGFGVERFGKENFGPILFKEETTFRREIHQGEDITVELLLKGLSKNGERFKLFHKIYKEDGVLAAEIMVFGAWMDLKARKLTTPPSDVLTMIDTLEKTEDYEEIPLKSK